MGPLRETDQTPLWTPTVETSPAVAGTTTAPDAGPTAAEVAALVRGPLARSEADPGSWGLLLVPVIVSVALVVAVWLAF